VKATGLRPDEGTVPKPDVEARKKVIDFEKSQGSQVLEVPRGSGFDVRVRAGQGEKHIEVKGIQHDDKFFAVNGLVGVRNLLFDNDYHLYFYDVSNGIILVASKDFVFRNMGWKDSEDVKRLIRAWTDTAEAIKGISSIAVDGRIRFTLQHPIRSLIKQLQSSPSSISAELLETIVSLWKCDARHWIKLYP